MNEKEKIKQAQAAAELRENLPHLIEMQSIFARVTRAKYLELVKQGFTETQALELCKG